MDGFNEAQMLVNMMISMIMMELMIIMMMMVVMMMKVKWMMIENKAPLFICIFLSFCFWCFK